MMQGGKPLDNGWYRYEQWDLVLGLQTGKRCKEEGSMIYGSVKATHQLEMINQSKTTIWNTSTVRITNKLIAHIIVL